MNISTNNERNIVRKQDYMVNGNGAKPCASI